MSVTRHTLDLENRLTKEWLITNGLGGYASSTITGCNTRKYHGLLVAAFNPPAARQVMVSRVEETIFYKGQELKLSTAEYPNDFYLHGYKYIKQFTTSPLPTTEYQSGEVAFRKTAFMVHKSNTTVLEYTNTASVSFKIRLTPLFAVRDFHCLLREEHDYKYFAQHSGGNHALYAYAGASPLYFKHSKGKFTENRYWNKNNIYSCEKERGYEFIEDVYCLGHIDQEIQPGESLYLIFTLDQSFLQSDGATLKEEELARLSGLVPKDNKNDFLADLIVAGDQFIVRRGAAEKYSIIAGYHWFTDWGRDTMISVRGLCIAMGKQRETASIILTFINQLKDGIIPNRFADYEGDEPEYNTIDATLWMFIAVYEFDLKFKDDEFLSLIYTKLKEILDHHINGSALGIHITPSGLLSGSVDGMPLTWMDARIETNVFTPRRGCAVEVNALWYNALRIFEHITHRLRKRTAHSYKAVAYMIENSFEDTFWNAKGYLNDVVADNGSQDQSIRPNQIYAVSLPFSLLPQEKEKLIVENVGKHLLTKYGLRTLARKDPNFKANYEGDVWSRDAAYHQGTVWPFLLPEYQLAYLKVHNYSSRAKKEVEHELRYLKDHFYNNECLHGISEVFDGESPKSGKGCIQQAWSVANLIWLISKADLEI